MTEPPSAHSANEHCWRTDPKINHASRDRAEFGRQMSLSFGTTEISPIPMFASSGPTPSETRSGVVGRARRSRNVTGD